QRLAPVLASSRPRKHVHGLKDALVLLKRHRVELGGAVSDPMIASYLLDPARAHDLASVCKLHLGVALDSRVDLCGSGKKAVLFEAIEIGRAQSLARWEAEATLERGRRLGGELERRQMLGLLDDMELPLSGVLAVMESHGIRLDVGALKRLGESMAVKLQALEAEVRALTGTEV